LVCLSVSVAGAVESDSRSIFFEPQGRSERMTCSSFLSDELLLRSAVIDNGTLEEKRECLRAMLILEYRFEYLTTFLDAPTLEHSYIKLEQAIPCIMHCENHAGK